MACAAAIASTDAYASDDCAESCRGTQCVLAVHQSGHTVNTKC